MSYNRGSITVVNRLVQSEVRFFNNVFSNPLLIKLLCPISCHFLSPRVQNLLFKKAKGDLVFEKNDLLSSFLA